MLSPAVIRETDPRGQSDRNAGEVALRHASGFESAGEPGLIHGGRPRNAGLFRLHRELSGFVRFLEERTVGTIAGRWGVNGCFNPAELGKAVDFVYANPEFKDFAQVAVTDITDGSFVQAALDAAGIDSDPGLDKR